MDGQIPAAVKRRRHARAMKLQQRIAGEISARQVGRRLRVLTDAPLVARTQADAPEVDGRVLLDAPAPVGEFVEVEVTGTQVYDLVARRTRLSENSPVPFPTVG